MKSQEYKQRIGVKETFWNNIVVPTMLKKYNYKCSICENTKNLHVHHTSYELVNIDTLIVLCASCHIKETQKRLYEQ